MYNKVKPRGCHQPYLYGLPKTHKPNVVIISVLSMVNYLFHKLARWLAKHLEPTHSKLAVYNLKDAKISAKSLVSFDISSLFTAILLEETIQIMCHHTDLHLPKEKFKQLSLICTKDIHFQFNNIYYC